MKIIFRQLTTTGIALATTMIVHLSGAQNEESGFGFLEMVNLISLEEPTYLTFGGFKISGGESVPAGGSSGYSTIKAGNYSFSVSNAGAKPETLEGNIRIEDARNSKIVFFDVVRIFDDESEEHKLRYTILNEADSGKGARLTLVSLLNEEFSSARINGKRGPANGREPFVFPVKVGDEITIEAGGVKMDALDIDDDIHFLCFVFRNPETGKAELSVVRNEKLEYHPPLEEDEKTESAPEADAKDKESPTAPESPQ